MSVVSPPVEIVGGVDECCLQDLGEEGNRRALLAGTSLAPSSLLNTSSSPLSSSSSLLSSYTSAGFHTRVLEPNNPTGEEGAPAPAPAPPPSPASPSPPPLPPCNLATTLLELAAARARLFSTHR